MASLWMRSSRMGSLLGLAMDPVLSATPGGVAGHAKNGAVLARPARDSPAKTLPRLGHRDHPFPDPRLEVPEIWCAPGDRDTRRFPRWPRAVGFLLQTLVTRWRT